MRSLDRRTLALAGIVTLAAAGPALAMSIFGHVMVMVPMNWHFAVVGCTAVVALAAAVALTVAGARRREGRAVLIGASFSATAALLFVHALATPTILIGPNGLVALAGALGVPVGAAILSLSAWPRLRRPAGVGGLLRLQAALLAGIAMLGGAGLLRPDAIPAMPQAGSRLAVALLLGGLALLSILAYRSGRTFLLTRRSSDLAVLVGVVWLGCSLAGLLLYGYMDLAFWMGHGFEVCGIALIAVPTALDLRRGAQSFPLAGDFSAAKLVSEEETFLGARVRALMLRLAEKDDYTEEHTRRVALLAVEVGERLGLAPSRLRTLALAGLLHDIGKLSVPDTILQKPGALDDDEFAVIRRHPGWGDELLAELGGFGADVHRIVLDHHERLDGAGYPRGLDAAAIDLETRIMTICDVYDALISTRVYREAWSAERALALLHSEIGTAFDPACVAALEAVLTRERASAPAASLRLAAA